MQPCRKDTKDRLYYWQGTREKTKHMADVGQLIPAAEHERQLASVLKVLATTIESLPDNLERDCGIAGEAIIRAQLVCDRMRETLYQRLLELTGGTE